MRVKLKKGAGIFYDHKSRIKVLPGEIKDIDENASDLVGEVLRNGGLVVVRNKESREIKGQGVAVIDSSKDDVSMEDEPTESEEPEVKEEKQKSKKSYKAGSGSKKKKKG